MTYPITCPDCSWTAKYGSRKMGAIALEKHRLRKHSGDAPAEDAPKQKRKYTRKPKVQEKTVSFCPNCGTNIHNVAVGMVLAENMKG